MPITTYSTTKRTSKFEIGDLVILNKTYYRVMENPERGYLLCLPHDPELEYKYVILREIDVEEEPLYMTYVEPSVKGREIKVGIYSIKTS
jgi:hypothetical protein